MNLTHIFFDTSSKEYQGAPARLNEWPATRYRDLRDGAPNDGTPKRPRRRRGCASPFSLAKRRHGKAGSHSVLERTSHAPAAQPALADFRGFVEERTLAANHATEALLGLDRAGFRSTRLSPKRGYPTNPSSTAALASPADQSREIFRKAITPAGLFVSSAGSGGYSTCSRT